MEERFWSKVDKSGDCWLWMASKREGYGKFKVDGKTMCAHRVSWILTNGAIPDGLLVRHKCRNQCVNPAHLELGTVKDNVGDRIRDGTNNNGEKHGMSKLTATQVLEIRRRAKEGSVKLAKEFGVCYQTISEIIHKKSWTHIVDETPMAAP